LAHLGKKVKTKKKKEVLRNNKGLFGPNKVAVRKSLGE